MPAVSDLVRNYTRTHGLPRKPCGHAITFTIDGEGKCKECADVVALIKKITKEEHTQKSQSTEKAD